MKSELVRVVYLGIKQRSPTFANLRINLIPVRYPEMGIPCMENFNLGNYSTASVGA